MGGEDAEPPVEEVLPGALAPALVEDDGPNGQFFSAIDHNLDPDQLINYMKLVQKTFKLLKKSNTLYFETLESGLVTL